MKKPHAKAIKRRLGVEFPRKSRPFLAPPPSAHGRFLGFSRSSGPIGKGSNGEDPVKAIGGEGRYP
jgi:hypothetical protein